MRLVWFLSLSDARVLITSPATPIRWILEWITFHEWDLSAVELDRLSNSVSRTVEIHWNIEVWDRWGRARTSDDLHREARMDDSSKTFRGTMAQSSMSSGQMYDTRCTNWVYWQKRQFAFLLHRAQAKYPREREYNRENWLLSSVSSIPTHAHGRCYITRCVSRLSSLTRLSHVCT